MSGIFIWICRASYFDEVVALQNEQLLLLLEHRTLERSKVFSQNGSVVEDLCLARNVQLHCVPSQLVGVQNLVLFIYNWTVFNTTVLWPLKVSGRAFHRRTAISGRD